MGSDPADYDGLLLKVIKFRRTSYFGEEVNMHLHVVRFYGMIKNPESMKEILRWQNSRPHLAKILPATLLGVYARYI
jgi:hypothetical protein